MPDEFAEFAGAERWGSSREMAGTVEITVTPQAAARMLCAVSHPLAINLGTIEPGVPCCSNCTLYPQAE
jgi:hypothetical protein